MGKILDSLPIVNHKSNWFSKDGKKVFQLNECLLRAPHSGSFLPLLHLHSSLSPKFACVPLVQMQSVTIKCTGNALLIPLPLMLMHMMKVSCVICRHTPSEFSGPIPHFPHSHSRCRSSVFPNISHICQGPSSGDPKSIYGPSHQWRTVGWCHRCSCTPHRVRFLKIWTPDTHLGSLIFSFRCPH